MDCYERWIGAWDIKLSAYSGQKLPTKEFLFGSCHSGISNLQQDAIPSCLLAALVGRIIKIPTSLVQPKPEDRI
jgi:hypothetical protein